jgi:hypothetical protein
MKNNILLVTVLTTFISSVFTSCNTSNEKTNKTVENIKSEISNPKISDTVVVKSTDVKTNQVKQNSIEGTYVNSRNTIVKISKATNKGFSFECVMKSECGGMETMNGFATYVNANKALTNISSEYEGDVFHIEKGVLVRFEPNGSYIGMDCQRTFDTEFSKK